ncbi:MAG: hypothetical protein ACI8PZ_003419 [Myxococcota bacterium]|jgi:hypothetical protein
MWMLIAAAVASPLTLGDGAWYVDGGAWSDGRSAVTFDEGFAFPVEADGERLGVIFVGEATHTLQVDPSLPPALGRELALTTSGDSWSTGVDSVWSLGANGVDERTSDWRRIRGEDPVIYDLDAPVQPTLLVIAYRELAAARRAAAERLLRRSEGLAEAGFPLDTAVATLATDGPWALVEVRTELDLGRLAGNRAGRDPWLTTLANDVLVGGSGVVSVAFGRRFIESASAC